MGETNRPAFGLGEIRDQLEWAKEEIRGGKRLTDLKEQTDSFGGSKDHAIWCLERATEEIHLEEDETEIEEEDLEEELDEPTAVVSEPARRATVVAEIPDGGDRWTVGHNKKQSSP